MRMHAGDAHHAKAPSMFSHIADESARERWEETGIPDDPTWVKILQRRSFADLQAEYGHIVTNPDIWALEYALSQALDDPTFRFQPSQEENTPASASFHAREHPSPRRPCSSAKTMPKTEAFRKVLIEVEVSDEPLNGGIWKMSKEATALLAAIAEIEIPSQCSAVYKCCRVLIWEIARRSKHTRTLMHGHAHAPYKAEIACENRIEMAHVHVV